MATAFRPWITRYYLDGRQVPKGTKGAQKAKERSKTYYAQGVPGRKGRVSLETTSKTEAGRKLAALVDEAGDPDPTARHRKTDLTDLIAAYRDHLAADRSPEHAEKTANRVTRLVEGIGARTQADVTGSAVAKWLGEQRRTPKAEGGFGPATSNAYLTAAKAFCNWLVKDRRALANPLQYLGKADARADVRRARREFTPDEVRGILAAAAASAVTYRGMTGPDRRMVYLTALGTGFRTEELASLTPAAFELDGDLPTVTAAAAYTKNGAPARQPIARDLAALLRPYLAGRAPAAPVWPGTWHERSADMLKIDLEAAGVPYVVESADGTPRHADFHAFRHTYVSSLGRSGLSPKQAQVLARHSTPALTLGVYSHVTDTELGEAVAKLPAAGQTKGSRPQLFDGVPREAVEALALIALALVAPEVAPTCPELANVGESDRPARRPRMAG